MFIVFRGSNRYWCFPADRVVQNYWIWEKFIKTLLGNVLLEIYNFLLGLYFIMFPTRYIKAARKRNNLSTENNWSSALFSRWGIRNAIGHDFFIIKLTWTWINKNIEKSIFFRIIHWRRKMDNRDWIMATLYLTDIDFTYLKPQMAGRRIS